MSDPGEVERAAFEKWVRERYATPMDRLPGADRAWAAWQARASLRAHRGAAGEPVLAALDAFIRDFSALMAESHGVDGLHRNGDLATWEELRDGGRFDSWLGSFDALLRARAAFPPSAPAWRDSFPPTHYCRECKALWRRWPDGSWSLVTMTCGKCCDNAPMGEQIVPLGDAGIPPPGAAS